MTESKTKSRNYRYTADDLPQLSPFGSVLAPNMSISLFSDGAWSTPELKPLDSFQLHPGAHCLHYGSSCFEGLKAYRWEDDSLVIFRPDRHVERMQHSAATLRLPILDGDMLSQMLIATVEAAAEEVPPAPGSLYLRPVLIGTDPKIGAASKPSNTAAVYVLASPVGDYFAGGDRALRLLVEKTPRTTPQFGKVKTGANYAAALGITMDANAQWNVDQILFCPENDVQETGASNFILIDDSTIVTKPLSDSFLHGVTRNSVLTIAQDLGYQVQERDFTIEELLDWTKHGEAALTGTAAALAAVGTLIYEGQEYPLCGNKTGPNVQRLRTALIEIQRGIASDSHGWIHRVG